MNIDVFNVFIVCHTIRSISVTIYGDNVKLFCYSTFSLHFFMSYRVRRERSRFGLCRTSKSFVLKE